jgi:outer membrane protein assembly factor BamC
MNFLASTHLFCIDMTTPSLNSIARLPVLSRGLAVAFLLAGTAGCSSVSSMLEPEKIDYKSASAAKPKSKLDVPPDLTQLKTDNRYSVPDTGRGTATASTYNEQRGIVNTTVAVDSNVAVAPGKSADIRIERAGSQRWLVVGQTPEVLWPRIKDFWQESGFLLALDLPESGIMETDWSENRAKIPQDFIRETIGKVFDGLYSTGERDKFRTRLERNPDGSTEIFISHRGAIEVLTGQMKEKAMWTARPSDPELEAEFIGRMMSRLGTDAKLAKAAVAAAKPNQLRARVVKEGATAFVAVDEPFDRAWRRVGLSLDRVGFTVEDRDRNRGLYFVRYVDQVDDAGNKVSEPGFFSKWFSSKDDKKSAKRYRVFIKSIGETSQVSVLDELGGPTSSTVADRILSILNEQLK